MGSKTVVRARGLDDLRATGLGSVADRLASHLTRRCVAPATGEIYLRVAAHFSHWLDRRGEQAGRESVRTFLVAHLPRCRCLGPVQRSLITVRAALGHLVQVLREGALFDECLPPRRPVDDEVDRYDCHLASVCGAAASTRARRRLDVSHLLTMAFGDGPVDSAAIRPEHVRCFVSDNARRYRPGTLGVIATSLRGYLRFLRLEGRCPEGLEEAVPRIAKWRLASLPVHLDDDEVRRLLASFNPRSPRGRRDRAMILCMVVLGLRAAEVAALRLGDADWRGGRIRVPATKTRRTRELPLPEAVGRSIVSYLRHSRPPGVSDHLFVRIGLQEGEPLDSSGVRTAARLAYARAGFPRSYTGTHRLRHTAATRLAVAGASVKAIADILGHASLDSTAIYSKVALPRLRAVALPWPGRS